MKLIREPKFTAVAALIILTICHNSTDAQSNSWINGSGGYWDVGSNWDSGFPPTTHDAIFEIDASYTVDWDDITGDRTAGHLHATNGNIVFQNLETMIYELQLGNSNGNSFGVDGNQTDVTIRGLRIDSSAGLTLVNQGATLTLDGNNDAGTELIVDFIRVGINGLPAQLNVDQGATVQSGAAQIGIGSAGTVVMDEGSQWSATNRFSVGAFGPGTLIMNNGSSLNGEARLDVGFQGDGLLTIEGGSSVVVKDIASIGQDDGVLGTVTIAGSGSELIVQELDGVSTIRVGDLGTGELMVSDQATAQANDVVVIGTATVSGLNSQILTDTLNVEGQQFGSLNVVDDARVDVSGIATIDFLSNVTMSGSATPQLTAGLTVNNGLMSFTADIGPDVFGDVENNFLIQSADNVDTWFHDDFQHDGVEVATGAGGRTRILGTASGDGPYTGLGEVEFVSAVRPGIGDGVGVAGIIDIEGQLDFGPDAVLHIELGGVVIDQNDRIFVDGNAELDGDISVSLIGGFEPSVGDLFPVIVIGGIQTGVFDSLAEGDVVATFGDVDLVITYSFLGGNDVGLEAVSNILIPGDVNGDGIINLLDVQPFVDAISSGEFVAAADINQDGEVNLLDVEPFVVLLAG